MKMKTASLLLVSFLSVCGAATAQNAPLTGISESTDPQKIAEVERRAAEIKAAQQAGQPSSYPRSAGSSEMKPEKPAKNKKARKAKVRPTPTTA